MPDTVVQRLAWSKGPCPCINQRIGCQHTICITCFPSGSSVDTFGDYAIHTTNCERCVDGKVYLHLGTLLERCSCQKGQRSFYDIHHDLKIYQCPDCNGTGYVDVTTVEKLWLVPKESGETFHKVVQIIIGDLQATVQFAQYWFAELTEAERMEALATAILEVQE